MHKLDLLYWFINETEFENSFSKHVNAVKRPKRLYHKVLKSFSKALSNKLFLSSIFILKLYVSV